MAFSYSNAVSGGSESGGAGANVIDGAELQEIQTNELGFSALNGEARLQLFPKPWPADNLPAPFSSLLAVASTKGLLAAAGPDAVYITSTNKVREAFQSPPPEKTQTRPFEPAIKLPYAASHVVFSSDDSVLVVSPSTGGILAFQVDGLLNGQLDPALQIPTKGQSLRAVVPNPTAESAELFAIITTSGNVMLLDLKAGEIKSGNDGDVLRSGATCLSWSNRGKQLVIGSGDGAAIQMKPDGTLVATIPKSTTIPADSHVSGISWLENDTFFIIYTPNDTNSGIQPSEYYILQREPKTTNYTFHKLPEILTPFGVERVPSYHFISRLRNFPPSLQDLLLVTATTSTDIGLVSKSEKELSQDEPVTGVFTVTMVEDDSRRAQLPLSAEMQDTSPVGMVMDLSSSDKVANPIPSDPELEETDGPVPCLLVLNNEGILVGWWVIYNDSVRGKTTFSGFAAVSAANQGSVQAAQSPSPQSTANAPTFGEASRGGTFAKPATSTFGIPATQSSFGAAKPFGTSSPITADKPSWASTGFGGTDTNPSSALGKSASGSATPTGSNNTPAFGSASVIGSRFAAFGQPSGPSPSVEQPSGISTSPAFGHIPAFGAASTPSPFTKAAGDSKSSGFRSFAQGGGFASFAGGSAGQKPQSPFGAASGTVSFGQTSGTQDSQDSPFLNNKPGNTFGTSGSATSSLESPFATKKANHATSTYGTGNTFKLQSSFRGEESAKEDMPPLKESDGFELGSSFGNMLGESKGAVSPARDKEAEMDEESASGEATSDEATETSFRDLSTKPATTLVTPPSTFAQSKATPAPPVSSLFDQPQNDNSTPQPQSTTPAWSFAGPASTTPKETPNPHLTMFGTKTSSQVTPAVVQKSEPTPVFQLLGTAPEIKEEFASDDESSDLKNIPEAPLPPDTTSKPRYASGETSASSNHSKTPPDDAPLPPDFLPVPRAGKYEQASEGPPEDNGEEFSSDFDEGEDEDDGQGTENEGSQVEDVIEERTDQLQMSPESSFKTDDRSLDASPTGDLFTKVDSTSTAPKPSRPLFGEVREGPIFAPPKPQESPRSPSPIRPAFSTDALRADPSRSVSAPAHPRSVIDKRKAEYQMSGLAAQAARTREEEAAKETARRGAIAKEKAQAEAEQLASLEDDEDERLRQELEMPITPSETLGDFVTYQPKQQEETSKTGIPAQIERLYADINSMVYTLGINSRSLTAFMQYQQPEASNQSWPNVLKSETPLDALNDELFLTDIARLPEGHAVLSSMFQECDVRDYLQEYEEAQAALKKEVFELRNKVMSIRKTLHSLFTSNNTITTPLSAEQASIQNDLRKAFTSVQTKMVQIEDGITVLRVKLAQWTPPDAGPGLGRAPSQKKPTVEAVTKTVGKMMSMAEQKSTEIDVLELQLKKLDISAAMSMIDNGAISGTSVTTPPRNRPSTTDGTPGSAGSIYHTPNSNLGSSTRSLKGLRTSQNGGLSMISAQDKQQWQAKSRRHREVASMLKDVLGERRKGAIKAIQE